MCLLLVPLQVMSSDEGAKAADHVGKEAAVKEQSGKAADHGGKPAASKEHAGNEVPAES